MSDFPTKVADLTQAQYENLLAWWRSGPPPKVFGPTYEVNSKLHRYLAGIGAAPPVIRMAEDWPACSTEP